MNYSMQNNIETIFIITEAKYSHISSTLVRDIIKNGGDVSQFIPEEIKTLISFRINYFFNARKRIFHQFRNIVFTSPLYFFYALL